GGPARDAAADQRQAGKGGAEEGRRAQKCREAGSRPCPLEEGELAVQASRPRHRGLRDDLWFSRPKRVEISLRHQMFSPSPEFSLNSPRILDLGEYAGDHVWRLSALKLLSKRSSQLAMVTFTEHSRLCCSSMSF